jgi:uncharacterized membrane protein
MLTGMSRLAGSFLGAVTAIGGLCVFLAGLVFVLRERHIVVPIR